MTLKPANSALVLGAALTVAAALGCAEGPGVELSGDYELRSSFRTPNGIPEREAEQLVAFTRLSEDPERVEEWLLDRLVDELDEPLRTALVSLREGYQLDAELRTYLSLVAPDYEDLLVELSGQVAELTRSLHVHSELELAASGDGSGGDAYHTVTGMWFELGGEELVIDLGDSPSARVSFAVGRDDDTGELLIELGDHGTRLSYGHALDLLITEELVERHDPFADSLSELVARAVPCADVGQLIADLAGTGSGTPEAFGVACAAAFGELGKTILPERVRGMSVTLDLEGDALLLDSDDADDRVDILDGGEWQGDLSYPSTRIDLRRPDNVFAGQRKAGWRNNSD